MSIESETRALRDPEAIPIMRGRLGPLAWLIFAWLTATNGQQISPEHASVVREQDALLTELRRFVNVFVADEDIRFLEGQKTPVKDGDLIDIVPAIAGG